MTTGNEKSDKMLLVARATIKTLGQFGLSGVTFARVARASGVSRPWLYKYIGGSQEELVEFTLDTFGKMFGKLDQPITVTTPAQWKDAVIERFGNLLDTTEEYPWVLAIYYRYRGTKGPMGEKLKEIEEKFFKNQIAQMQKLFGHSKERARVVAEVWLGVRLGLAFRWINTELPRQAKKEDVLGFMSRALDAVIQNHGQPK